MAFFQPSHNSFMFQAQLEDHHDSSSFPSTSLNSFPSLPPPQHFLGVGSLMLKRSMSFSDIENKCEGLVTVSGGEEELWEEGLLQFGEKKKRLNMEQVKALEKSFEKGNKLEPERKTQLAKALGLQPRQIAIWFQNRRARWKTKQLEKDFESLKKQFEAAKADHVALKAHNHNLQAELQALKSRDYCEAGTIRLKQEIEGCWSNGSDDNNNNNTTSDNINLDLSRAPIIKNSPMSSQNGNQSLQSTDDNNSMNGTSISTQLPYSSRPEIQDEGFCNNMFHNNVDDDEQHNLWPWPEHHLFH